MHALYDLFVLPLLRYGFLRNGMAVAVVVGVTSAVLSCLLTVRHQSLLGDAISHAVLPGVAIGWLVAGRLGIFWGALVAALLAGATITYLERTTSVKLDALMGIVFTFAFAVGLAIISLAKPRGIDLFHVLLGNVLGVDLTDLAATATSGGLVLALVFGLYRPFHLWSFDPVTARAVGMPTRTLHYLFTALLSVTIVSSLQAVGLVLVVAMLVTPGATAYLLTRRLPTMMAVAAVAGLLAAVGGLYGSYHLDVASGPAIVVCASVLFAAAFAFGPRGLLPRTLRARTRARRILGEDILKRAVEREAPALHLPDLTPAGTPRGVARGALRRLRRMGLVSGDAAGRPGTTSQAGVALTPAGRREGLRIVRAHRLLERYLHDAEAVALPDLHHAAEELEHEVSAADIERLAGRLNQPAVDPHGHPIPTAAGELAQIAGRALAHCQPGRTGTIAMVADDRDDLLSEMVTAGVLPRRRLTVVGSTPAGLEVAIDGLAVHLSPDVAERIFVTVDTAPPDPAAPHHEQEQSCPTSEDRKSSSSR